MDKGENVRPIWTWIKRGIVAIWLIVLASILPLADYYDSVLFYLIATIIPGLLLLIFILTIFIGQIVGAARNFIQNRSKRGWLHILVALAGIFAIPAGRPLGDAVAVMTVGGRLKAATEPSSASKVTYPLQATPAASIYIVDGFFFTLQGIAYDNTGRLGELLMTEPDERPEEWQKSMPEVLQSRGYARHIWGKYWKVSMAMS